MSKIDKSKMADLFTLLLKARRLEEKLSELSEAGLIPGWVHSCLGQEAVGVGVVPHLNDDDYINLTHRGRPQLVAKGVNLKLFLAEAMGKKDGLCKGRSGEMHFADKEAYVLSGNAIIGASLPICSGVAFSCKLRNTGQIVVCFFGDGASEEGTFQECLNFASIWKLPILFVCENNGWAQFVPQSETSAVLDVSKRAAAYNIPAKTVYNGSDVLAVYNAAGEAIAMAREMQPNLLEFKVHRWLGHYVGDPQKYRDPKDIEECRKDDPVKKFQKRLLKEKILEKNEIDNIDRKVREEIEEAVKFAMNSPKPDIASAFEDVFYDGGGN